MSFDNDPNALASALPADVQMISLDGIERDHQRRIGQIQAEHLTASGYVLLHGEHVDEDTVERVARTLWHQIVPDPKPEVHWEVHGDWYRDLARAALAALAAPRADEPAEVEHG